jgi:hypothetical protein
MIFSNAFPFPDWKIDFFYFLDSFTGQTSLKEKSLIQYYLLIYITSMYWYLFFLRNYQNISQNIYETFNIYEKIKIIIIEMLGKKIKFDKTKAVHNQNNQLLLQTMP